VHAENPKIDKAEFAQIISAHYSLQKARSVYFADDFAVRFCYSNDAGFSNCVVSLSTLRKYDDRPFLVVLLQPSGVRTFLANSTLIRKVSHSSHKLSVENVRGTILGHDITQEFDGVSNEPRNFSSLFETHQGFDWFHWAGRDSRGVTQLAQDSAQLLAAGFMRTIDIAKASRFIDHLIAANPVDHSAGRT